MSGKTMGGQDETETLMEATVMEGGENGVIVSVHENKALVDFEFNRPLMAMLRELPGAAYNKEDVFWQVPFAGGEEAHKVNLVVTNMREELGLDAKDRDQVSNDVRTAVIAKMVENGSQASSMERQQQFECF